MSGDYDHPFFLDYTNDELKEIKLRPGLDASLTEWSRAALIAEVEKLKLSATRSERVFEAVVHAYEGERDKVPEDLLGHGFVKRGLRHFQQTSVNRQQLEESLDALEGRLEAMLDLIQTAQTKPRRRLP